MLARANKKLTVDWLLNFQRDACRDIYFFPENSLANKWDNVTSITNPAKKRLQLYHDRCNYICICLRLLTVRLMKISSCARARGLDNFPSSGGYILLEKQNYKYNNVVELTWRVCWNMNFRIYTIIYKWWWRGWRAEGRVYTMKKDKLYIHAGAALAFRSVER